MWLILCLNVTTLYNQVFGLGFFFFPASLPRNALSAKKADCRVFALFSFWHCGGSLFYPPASGRNGSLKLARVKFPASLPRLTPSIFFVLSGLLVATNGQKRAITIIKGGVQPSFGRLSLLKNAVFNSANILSDFGKRRLSAVAKAPANVHRRPANFRRRSERIFGKTAIFGRSERIFGRSERTFWTAFGRSGRLSAVKYFTVCTLKRFGGSPVWCSFLLAHLVCVFCLQTPAGKEKKGV